MRRLVVGLAMAALASSAQAQSAGLDAVFAGYKAQTPGCAVGVREKGKADVLRGYGSADLEHGVAITPDTVFEAGSVSKQFTAAAILLLVEDGKIALSDDIRKYLPEMPVYAKPITVDMLLSHTSGLRDWGSVMELAGWPRTSRVYTPVEVLQIASRQKGVNYTPGEAYSYTNTGYNLAAWIVLRVSGQTLAEFTKARIFTPLGMTRTSWRDDFRRIVPGRAIAYGPAPGGYRQDMPFENTYGHGGLLTTVGDLLTWNQALTDGRLGKQVAQRMAQPATLTSGRKITYGRGLFVQTWQSQPELSHSGSTAGYRAWLGRYPAQGLSVALLCNSGDTNPTVMARRVADLSLPPGPGEKEPPPIAQPLDELERLPGIYVDERAGFILRVAPDKGVLVVRGGGPLKATAAGRYRGGGAEFVFLPDKLQRTDSLGDVMTLRRMAPVTPTDVQLAELAGAYSSPEAGAVLRVTVRGGALVIAPADRPSAPSVARPLYKDAFQTDNELVRIVRGQDGKVQALRFTGPRVYSLDFRRVAGS